MKGNDKVIEQLNGLLAWELGAMDQYFIHSQMYDDWGLGKLYERIGVDYLHTNPGVPYRGTKVRQR